MVIKYYLPKKQTIKHWMNLLSNILTRRYTWTVLKLLMLRKANQSDKGAQKVMIAALKDKYYGLRIKAIRALNMSNDDIHNAALPVLTSLAQTDENTLVRAAAITALGKLKASGNMNLFKQALSSQSYAVQGAALTAIDLLDPAQALTLAKGFEKDNKGALTQAIDHCLCNKRRQ